MVLEDDDDDVEEEVVLSTLIGKMVSISSATDLSGAMKLFPLA